MDYTDDDKPLFTFAAKDYDDVPLFIFPEQFNIPELTSRKRVRLKKRVQPSALAKAMANIEDGGTTLSLFCTVRLLSRWTYTKSWPL
jgi:hypothetical protein